MECKIYNSHRRLLESHRLWHQTMDNYFDPEGFRVNLNATIQALRNLTFALQNEKRFFNDFEGWYSSWQAKMKEDPILKWLNSARVEIVHKKDLEKVSLAKVSVLGYQTILQLDISLPIDLPEYMVAYYLLENKYICEDIISKDYVLKVERRWIVSSLPEHEILDALAYCYGFMYKLIEDAHREINLNINQCGVCDNLHNDQESIYNDLGIPDCMELSNRIRTKMLSLKSLNSKKLEERECRIDRETIKDTVKRYKINAESLGFATQKDKIKEFAFGLLELAKKVLVKDGYHVPIVYLKDKHSNMNLIGLKIPEDKSDKFIMMQHIAERVRESRATGIVLLVETWITSDICSYLEGIPTEEHKNKQEGLIVYVATKDGINTSFISIFSRGILGKIRFQETIENKLDNNGILSPIYQIWDEC